MAQRKPRRTATQERHVQARRGAVAATSRRRGSGSRAGTAGASRAARQVDRQPEAAALGPDRRGGRGRRLRRRGDHLRRRAGQRRSTPTRSTYARPEIADLQTYELTRRLRASRQPRQSTTSPPVTYEYARRSAARTPGTGPTAPAPSTPSTSRHENAVHMPRARRRLDHLQPRHVCDGRPRTLKKLVEGQPRPGCCRPTPAWTRRSALQSWGHQLKVDSADRPAGEAVHRLLTYNTEATTPEAGASCENPDVHSQPASTSARRSAPTARLPCRAPPPTHAAVDAPATAVTTARRPLTESSPAVHRRRG